MHPGLAYISATLKGAAASMSNKGRKVALACFEHWRNECQIISRAEPERVAFTLHDVIDERMQHMLETSKHGADVQCRKGCAACCHLHVEIFPQEAVLLRMAADESGIEIDEARLARQAAKDKTTWVDLPPEDQSCVFLDEDKACRVYEHRPGACRKYTVKSDPKFCDMTKYPGGKVGVVLSIEAEIVHSAAMTVYGVGGMARMLIDTRKTTP